jgi:hypothetical protein
MLALVTPDIRLVSQVRDFYSEYLVVHMGDIVSFLNIIHVKQSFLGLIWELPNNESDFQILKKLKVSCPSIGIMLISNKIHEDNTVYNQYFFYNYKDNDKLESFHKFWVVLNERANLIGEKMDLSYNNLLFITEGMYLNVETYCLVKQGINIPLSLKEYELLFYLLENRNRFAKTTEILHSVWDEFYAPEIVRQYILKLRNKIGEKAIKVIHRRGIGYRLYEINKSKIK